MFYFQIASDWDWNQGTLYVIIMHVCMWNFGMASSGKYSQTCLKRQLKGLKICVQLRQVGVY